jgi:Uma2 family endonuclease
MEAFVLKGKVTGGLTDEEFFWFCQENKDLRIERSSKLEIYIKSPVTTLSAFWNMEISRQLANWAIQDGKGLAFDSSAGFTLSDRSVLSPDASWVSKEKWNSLSNDEKNRFAPTCPEFVIEVRSKSDHIDDLKMKMRIWVSNGAELAWLVDPIKQISYLFNSRERESEKIVRGIDQKIEGEGKITGFVLDLSLLKI